jgi:hypothetical protein
LRNFAGRDLAFLILLGPLDLFLYRPITFYAQFKWLIDFLRGDQAVAQARQEPPVVGRIIVLNSAPTLVYSARRATVGSMRKARRAGT